MKKLNPIERSRYIQGRYKEYLRSSFQFGNDNLQRLFLEELERMDLFRGPYVALELPFQRGKTIRELVEEGVVCISFLELDDVSVDRPLYVHQEQAIRQICSGRSAVITTGTGSGKTECFLYPILNELLSDIEKGNHEVGIRAIFLYPMNALVNDQIDRVRGMLKNCPSITYGFFTGDTKETVPADYREKHRAETGICLPENELVSREEIRENPPHLLFTNYSMLEYMLIRPNDYSLFEQDRLKNWKFVVLDEAHSYTGAQGIELSLLMRRVTGLAKKKPRFILTSATLGQQGKSEKEIVSFAKNLTSVTFREEDIIFSSRIELNHADAGYTVFPADYEALKAHLEEPAVIREICSEYFAPPGNDISEDLFELLHADRTVHQLHELLKNESRSFDWILRSMGDAVNEHQLIDLIDLINRAEKNGIGLFELKYHSFVRPIAGAYVTVENSPRLSLTKTNFIGEKKAFEIGNCRYCGVPYIIGKIQRNPQDSLDYLYQNNEVDIYENYGNNIQIQLDYFLLEKPIADIEDIMSIEEENEDEVEEEQKDKILEEYILCGSCGHIYPAENLNARKCTCDDAGKKHIYRVIRKTKGDSDLRNNIGLCPCCRNQNRSGVVKGLNLGKDEGTALIAQMLYESLEEESAPIRSTGRKLLKKRTDQSMRTEEHKVKQFLSFSDSRQQASFAAVFFDATHVRMLRKRLIWKIIEDNQYEDLQLEDVTAQLTRLIKDKDLFQNDMNAHKNAWTAVLADLLKVDGNYDGEGLGLYYFDLDLSGIMEELTEEEVQEELGCYGLKKRDLETIMQVVLGTFKTTPAIDYTKSQLTPEERKDNLEFRWSDNVVEYNASKSAPHIKSFLPIKGKDNMIVRYVQRACNCSQTKAKDLLDIIFNSLGVEGGLLTRRESGGYQINAGMYVVKNYRRHPYYRCRKCGRMTPYNVHNVCVRNRCDGILEQVDPDEVLKDNYYRNQYKTKKIERIVIKEHTGQLDRETGKRYQREFKEKKINILSCSTTFEMGIDLGSLETVFMRNVPPTPANYVQRAGRAGRRRDSSAYILTYCGTGSHDYTYFSAPEKMISGIINPPHFDVMNRKIIVRHLMAASFGFFFRMHPEYFENIDRLVFGDGIEQFRQYILGHPDDLNLYINRKVLPEKRYEAYHDFRWFDENGDEEGKLNHFISALKNTENEFSNAIQVAVQNGNYQNAEYYSRQIQRLKNMRVLEALSKYCVIPKYGFPVDVVELQVYSKEGVPDNRYDLSRDLRIALSEYAPDSEVIVDGNKYTSKYITLPRTSEFVKNYFCTCKNCKRINVYLSQMSADKCRYCGVPIGSALEEYYIEPINGFKTGETKKSTHMKPKRSYAGEVSYLGGGRKDEKHLTIGKAISAESSTDDELLIVNRSDFYMCPVCGYGEISKRKTRVPHIKSKHKNYRQFDCTEENINRLRLGHSFRTDVVRFTIPMLSSSGQESHSIALSFLYAFLEGVSNALDIERNDIDGILELNLSMYSYDILLYDNVPGGAGQVKRLMKKEAIISALDAALVKVSQNCCGEDTSCYNCLRNYYNQAVHSRLKRSYAKNVIIDLFRQIKR